MGKSGMGRRAERARCGVSGVDLYMGVGFDYALAVGLGVCMVWNPL